MKPLSVLHIWDQGINYLLMKYMDAHCGTRSRMVASTEFDPFGMTPREWKRDYRGHSKYRLMWDIFREAIRADIVHVHSLDKVVPTLNLMGCHMVLHYHGSDIRGRWPEKRRYWECADRILVSTRNLLEGAPPVAKYQPNPIDVEKFKNDPDMNLHRAALYFDYGAVDLAEKIADDHDLPLVVMQKGVPYAELPYVLNRYTHYVDVKRDASGRLLMGKPDDTGSLLGLQALACGLTVLTLNGERVGLPPAHYPDRVADDIFSVYEELTR